jgi:hypothetical protein
MEGLLCVLGVVLFLVFAAAIRASVASHYVRPSQNDMVQMTWHQRERLERNNIGGNFWRFVAKLEFFLLVGAALWIMLLMNGQ